MNKKQLKTIKKSGALRYPSIGQSWKEDFVKLIPQSKRRKEIIKYVELVDWERIGHLISSEAKTVMKKIGVPQINDTLRLNSSIVEGIILLNIKERLHYLILHYLSSINKNNTKQIKNRKIKKMLSRVEFEIRRSKAVFVTILDVGSLKWIKDSDTKQSIIDNLKNIQLKEERPNRKKIHKDNIVLYRRIFEKNDEYIERDGEVDYLKAVRKVLKNASGKTQIRKYKSFWKIQSKYSLITAKDFENFLSTIHGR